MARHVQLSVVVLVVGLACSTARAEGPDDLLVIANASVPEDKLDIEDLEDIFLKRRSHWNGSMKIVPIHASAGSKIRDDFLALILEMSASDEGRYWQDKKIREGVTPPVEFSGSLKAVFKLKGGIGYVYRSQFKEGMKGVKVVFVLEAK